MKNANKKPYRFDRVATFILKGFIGYYIPQAFGKAW